MLPELLLLTALAAGVPENGYAQSGVAMAEDQARLESNPALLGSDALDRRWHGRFTLPRTRAPLDAYDHLEPHMGLLARRDPHEILADREFLDTFWKLDGIPVAVGLGTGLAVWQGDWAVSADLWAHPGLRIDRGVAIPRVEVWDSTRMDLRMAVSQPFGPFRVGTGLHLRGRTGSSVTTNLRDPAKLSDEIKKLQDSVSEHFQGLSTLDAGLDLGILHRLPHDLQWGASLMGVGLLDGAGDLERPRLDLGAAWIPSSFRAAGPRWDRRFALGVGLRDLLDTAPPLLSHLVLGATARHNLSPRGTEIRASTGLRGGWPTAGLGLSLGPVLLDVASWAQDLDRVLGRTPLENWEAQLQLGW